MRVYVLGTSGDAILTSRQILASGGLVFQTPEIQCNIDPGPGTLVQMSKAKLNPRNTDLLLLSHAHFNHCADATSIIAGMTYDLMDVRGVIAGPKSVFETHSGISIPKKYLSGVEKIITLKPEDKLEIKGFMVESVHAIHDIEALGFIIYSDNLKISVPCDTAYEESLFELYSGSDLLILNVVHSFDHKDSNNLSADDAIRIIEQCKPKNVLLTHFGMKIYNQGPLYLSREIKNRLSTNANVITGRDGMLLEYVAGSFNPRLL